MHVLGAGRPKVCSAVLTYVARTFSSTNLLVRGGLTEGDGGHAVASGVEYAAGSCGKGKGGRRPLPPRPRRREESSNKQRITMA